ncbi:lipopolysaccharide transport periplasmic protein LptA [Paucibacter sp. JuS9]|jgi:lipopolysaccharide export system protein LptA|uniref:lipopolysaccharide transport periplasmic protein LptA n=1 Tax=Roseateles TaxID=93681 RepID=UPI002FE5285F
MRPAHLSSSLLLSALALLAAAPAGAEKGDRYKPMNISYDEGGRVEIANQLTELTGNVILSQGSLLLKAGKVVIKETPDGFFQASATSDGDKQVSFSQGRDTPGEVIEGRADQIEYDSRKETVRFVGNAVLRQLRNGLVTGETTGGEIAYDNRSELFKTSGGNVERSPNGRGRMVLMPRAASAPEALPSASSAPTQLQPSTTLQTTPRKPS